MILCFTGTQRGLSTIQLASLERVMVAYAAPAPLRTVFVHGDCVGADAEAHEIAARLGWWIVVRP